MEAQYLQFGAPAIHQIVCDVAFGAAWIGADAPRWHRSRVASANAGVAASPPRTGRRRPVSLREILKIIGIEALSVQRQIGVDDGTVDHVADRAITFTNDGTGR